MAKLLLPSTIRWTSASDGCTAICSCVSIVSDKQKSRVESLTVDAMFVLRYRPRRRQEHKLAHRVGDAGPLLRMVMWMCMTRQHTHSRDMEFLPCTDTRYMHVSAGTPAAALLPAAARPPRFQFARSNSIFRSTLQHHHSRFAPASRCRGGSVEAASARVGL